MTTKKLILWAGLTHWGRVTHICVGKLTIIATDNGLSPIRRQAIIWTNAGILLMKPLETNFSENSIEILTFSFTKMRLKVSSAKWRPFCLGLSVLNSGPESPTPTTDLQDNEEGIFTPVALSISGSDNTRVPIWRQTFILSSGDLHQCLISCLTSMI